MLKVNNKDVKIIVNFEQVIAGQALSENKKCDLFDKSKNIENVEDVEYLIQCNYSK